MSRVLLRSFGLLVLSVAVCGLLNCGGAGSAPINGGNSLSGVLVAVSPSSMTVTTGNTQAFTATVYNSNVAGVQWLVNGFPGGGGNIGTIDSNGNYTAPQYVPIPPQVTVSAVSVADNTKSGTATVSITGTPIPAQVTISPAVAALNVGTILNLTAVVTGPADTAVIWQVVANGTGVVNGNSTVGTIVPGANGATAVYTAPANIPSGGTVTIKALSHSQPNVSAACVVTIADIQAVTLSNTTANVQVGASFSFTADVVGAGNTSLVWEVNGIPGGNATIGTVRASGPNNSIGTYTAPSTVPTTGTAPASVPTAGSTVTVTAVSSLLPSKFASATVTILPVSQNVSISISPTTAAVNVGANLNLSATVTGSSDTSVIWEVVDNGNGVVNGDPTVGTIVPGTNSASAVYTAPAKVPSGGTVTILAVSHAQQTVSASCVVTITNIGFTISPASANVQVGTSFVFTATVTGTENTPVIWEVNGIQGGNGTVGTVRVSGVNNSIGTYTAPSTVPTAGNTVTVTAVLPSESASATVTITAASQNSVSISISPISATVLASGNQQFTATVLHTTNTAVTWQVNGVTGGNSTYGTITSTGIDSATYVAPATVPAQNPVIVSAIPNAAPNISATASITVSGAATVTISPVTETVQTGTTFQFTASVSGPGVTNTTVFWEVNGIQGGNSTVGTIKGTNNVGTYTAPTTVPTPNVVTVTAVSFAQPSRSAAAQVTITPSAVTAQISPSSSTVVTNGTTQFTVTVLNTTNTAVTWQVNGVTGGNSTYGSITPTGTDSATYVAPSTVPAQNPVIVSAIPNAAPNFTATASVTITGVATVTISPLTVSVNAGTTTQLTATVTGTAITDTTVLWYVNNTLGGSPVFGTIAGSSITNNSNTAIYSAPQTQPTPPGNVVTVTAVSHAQPSRSASATVTITPPVANGVTVQVTGATELSLCAETEYTATVGNATNTSVSAWQVNGVTGGNSTYGTITPMAGDSNIATYVPPQQLPTPAVVVIGAIPAAAPNEVGTIEVTLTNPPVQVNVVDTQNNSSTAQVGVGLTVPLSATVTGSCTVQTATWYVGQNGDFIEGGNSTLGTIAPDSQANQVTYTAPATVPSNPTVTIEATSDAVPSIFGTATITINPAPVITVSITPSTPQTVDFQGSTGNANVEYFATITGSTSNNVTWEVNGYQGGDDTCQNSDGNPCGIGTIGPDPANPGNPLQALYTAPVAVPSPPTVNVTAVFAGPPQVVSNSDPVTIVTPPPPPPTISIVPASIFPIIPGQALSPQADVGCPGGGCNNVVDWSLSLPSGEGSSCTTLTPCGSLSLATGPCPGGNSLECQNTNNSPNLVYSSPTSIPSDPWDVTLTAILDSDQSVQATATIEITASATASISISPTNPTIQAGSSGTITFTATIINAPAGTNVTWGLQCNSLAPNSGEWCYDFSGDGGGPGCLDVNEKFCFTNSQEALPSTPATYFPPANLGSQFQGNACTSTQGTNGMVPLTAQITAGNCNTTSCTAQACITVTPP